MFNNIYIYIGFLFYLGRYFDEISQETGKYCFGVEDTLRALELGSVETLICWENLDIQRYVLKNHTNAEEKVLHLTPEQEKDKTHFTDKEVSITTMLEMKNKNKFLIKLNIKNMVNSALLHSILKSFFQHTVKKSVDFTIFIYLYIFIFLYLI